MSLTNIDYNMEDQIMNPEEGISGTITESDATLIADSETTVFMRGGTDSDTGNGIGDNHDDSSEAVFEDGSGSNREATEVESQKEDKGKPLAELTKKEIFELFKKLSQEGQAEEEIRESLGLSLRQYNSFHKRLYGPESGFTEPMPTYKACKIKSLNTNIKWALAKSFGANSDDRLIKIEPMTPKEFEDAYGDGSDGLVVLTLMPPTPTEWSIPKAPEENSDK